MFLLVSKGRIVTMKKYVVTPIYSDRSCLSFLYAILGITFQYHQYSTMNEIEHNTVKK